MNELPNAFWNVQIENDAFSLRDSDRYYTGGLQLSKLKPGSAIQWQKDLLEWLTDDKAYIKTAVEYSIGQNIFTPADISLVQPDPDDRPYAGWLYGTAATSFLIEQTPRLDVLHCIELTLGVIGPSSGAEGLQSSLHDIIDATEPQGWDSQLQDELGLGIATSRKWRIKLNHDKELQKDVTPHVIMSLGNVYTYLGGGVMLRVGKNLHADTGPPNIRPGFPGSAAFFTNNQTTSWYFFVGYESRLMLRNIFLDGNTIRDSPSVETELVVGDYQFGFVYRYKDFRFAFSNVFRSKEYENQDDITRYGAISMSYFL